jgi:xanthine dehydrogenase YagS FAD-binding subunit
MRVSSGRIDHIRVALGGVGVKPWRSKEAEAQLLGRTPDAAAFRAAAEAALQSARVQSQNGFKVELARRCIQHALTQATQTA